MIDFTLQLSPFSNDAWQNLEPGTSTAQDVGVEPNILSNPFFYFASSTNLTGDIDFCNAINVVATLNGDEMYNGPLSGLLTATTTLIDTWNLEFTNNQNFFNSVCQFDIDFNGWQTRHDYPKYHDGYSDTEKTTHILYSDGFKINKVYFEDGGGSCICGDPKHDEYGDDDEAHCYSDDNNTIVTITNTNTSSTTNTGSVTSETGDNSGGSTDTGDASSTSQIQNTLNTNTTILGGGGDHEWVELYNPNSDPADIDGWFLCDAQSCDVLHADAPVPGHGFAVVAGTEAAWNGWVVPDDFVKIVIDDGEIGDGLDNEDDALFLRRPDYFTFDQVNWGIPDPLWPYYVPELWNPGVEATTSPSMIARIPTGFDTNQVTDWQVLLRPSVDLLYPTHHMHHPWYWGFTYLVTWEATNPNGDDNDLLIDLILIQDTNYNHKVDKHDNRIVLKHHIENDGNEEITIPEGFIGYIWLEVVATGPENPMAHDFDRSGKIYDPIPQYMLDKEEDKAVIEEAVTDQVEWTGESEYSFMLSEPVTASTTEEAGATGTTTDETGDESGTTTPTTLEEDNSGTTTEEAVLDEGTTTPETAPEGGTASTTGSVEEDEIVPEEEASTTEDSNNTFGDDITKLINDSLAKVQNTIDNVTGSTTTDESTTTDQESSDQSNDGSGQQEQAVNEQQDIEPVE